MKQMKLMIFVLLAIMTGCKGKDNSLTLLRGQEWQLKSMVENGNTVNNPQELPTLLFSDSTAMYGSAGCNWFFGTYEVQDKGLISLKPGGATMMYCPDMAFEDQYLKSLPKVVKYTVSENQLTLEDKSGKLQLIYVPLVKAEKVVGVADDEHGCNAAAGYTWSEVRQNCVRLFEEGVKFTAVAGQDSTLAAYVVFAADSLKAEVFISNDTKHPILERRELPKGGYTWNQEDDDTLNVRQMDGKWVIEQRNEVLYSESAK